MAATGTPYSGKDGAVDIGGLKLNLDHWEANYKVTDLDSYNFQSGGFGQGSFGKHEIEGKASGFWDAGQNPQASPPKIRPGLYLTNMKLYLNKTDNIYISLPVVRITGVPFTAAVDELVKYEFSFKSHGTFDLPGGFTPTPLTTT